MKKGISIALSAAIATTVILPTFAQEEITVVDKTITKGQSNDLITKVRELLAIKYTEEGALKNKSAYKIEIGNEEITDAAVLGTKISALAENGQLTVKITDKGHQKIGQEIVSKKHEIYENQADLITTENAIKAATGRIYDKVDVTTNLNQSTNKLTVTLTDKVAPKTTSTITLSLNQEKIDITKVLDSSNNAIAIDNNFKANKVAKFDNAAPIAIKSKKLAQVTVKNADLTIATPEDIYDGYRLTAKGTEVKNGLIGTVGSISKDETTKVYSFVVSYTNSSKKPVELTLQSKDQAKLDAAREALAGNAIVDVIAGNDRYSTAVEIAKQTEVQDNIVIVNSTALVDGLAATPFAKSVNAPILLTTKTSVPTDTLDYIKEVIKKKPTAKIYIIGGESVISKTVETELAKLTKVERLYGADRHGTSVEVAKKMENVNDAFVVGATGEADAMSVSSYAAGINAPIIVNGWSGLSEESLKLLDGKNIDIVGGDKAVSNNVQSQLSIIDKDSKAERVEGITRHETNAAVIEKYYGAIKELYVAKDGYGNNEALVDALAAGPLAAGKGPILLATSDLNDAQQKVLNIKLSSTANITQVGNGVNLTVMQKIGKILGL